MVDFDCSVSLRTQQPDSYPYPLCSTPSDFPASVPVIEKTWKNCKFFDPFCGGAGDDFVVTALQLAVVDVVSRKVVVTVVLATVVVVVVAAAADIGCVILVLSKVVMHFIVADQYCEGGDGS